MLDELRLTIGYVLLFYVLVLGCCVVGLVVLEFLKQCKILSNRKKYRERLNNFLDRCQNTDAAPFSREEVRSILTFIKVLEDEYKNA